MAAEEPAPLLPASVTANVPGQPAGYQPPRHASSREKPRRANAF